MGKKPVYLAITPLHKKTEEVFTILVARVVAEHLRDGQTLWMDDDCLASLTCNPMLCFWVIYNFKGG